MRPSFRVRAPRRLLLTLLLPLAALAGAGRRAAPAHASPAPPGSVVGTWRLKRWEARGADGQVAYPLGPDALGSLIYTPGGHMSVAMMRAGRPPFAGDDLLGGTAEERAAAAAGYVAYSGRYEVRDGAVVHRVELSLFPNWVGSEQVRFATVDGDELTITTRPLRIGGETVSRLVWERVE